MPLIQLDNEAFKWMGTHRFSFKTEENYDSSPVSLPITWEQMRNFTITESDSDKIVVIPGVHGGFVEFHL